MNSSQLAAAAMEQQEGLFRDAINYALGTNDWTVKDVAYRGRMEYYRPNEYVFLFDRRPLLEVRVALDWDETLLFSTLHYRKLYDEKDNSSGGRSNGEPEPQLVPNTDDGAARERTD